MHRVIYATHSGFEMNSLLPTIAEDVYREELLAKSSILSENSTNLDPLRNDIETDEDRRKEGNNQRKFLKGQKISGATTPCTYDTDSMKALQLSLSDTTTLTADEYSSYSSNDDDDDDDTLGTDASNETYGSDYSDDSDSSSDSECEEISFRFNGTKGMASKRSKTSSAVLRADTEYKRRFENELRKLHGKACKQLKVCFLSCVPLRYSMPRLIVTFAQATN